MNKRFAAITVVVASAAVAAAGLFASPSNSASSACPNFGPTYRNCLISLTATGPSPSEATMAPLEALAFKNIDSVSHTVVFANGLCTLTLTPGELGTVWNNGQHPDCNSKFPLYAGSYPYTVDGKSPGTVVTTPWARSVTLTARTHTIRGGTRLILQGRVAVEHAGTSPPAPVVVLARHNSKQPFERIATVRTRFQGDDHSTYGWKLNVQPDVTTTYIAKVTGQRVCYFPTSQCAHPHGQVWTNAKSGPFTVRTRP